MSRDPADTLAGVFVIAASLALVWFVMTLAATTDKPSESVEVSEPVPARFVLISEETNIAKGELKAAIYEDTETGERYLIIDRFNGGVSVTLLNDPASLGTEVGDRND